MRPVGIALALPLALGACFSGGSSGSSATNDASEPDATAACVGSLSEFCADCPTTEQAARDQASLECGIGGAFPRATAGQCGDFRYVRSSGGFSSATYYYDGQDHLVGARFSTDTEVYCEGSSFTIALGTVPPCDFQNAVDLCQTPEPRLSRTEAGQAVPAPMRYID